MNLIWIAVFLTLFLFLQKVYGKPMDLSTEGRTARTLPAAEALEFVRNRAKDAKVIFLDIRTIREHQAGAIPSSQHLDFYDAGFVEKVKVLDQSKTYLIYCASGNRSKSALRIMHELGFKEIYEYDGGYSHYARNVK